MYSKFLFFLLLPLLCSLSSFGQKALLVKQLKAFIPPDFHLKDTAFGDLNADSRIDVILVLKSKKEDLENFEDTALDVGRPLLLLLQQADGKLKLVMRNDHAILCKECGGVMGDPYQGLGIEKNGFFIYFYGGSSWRWTDTYGFKWQPGRETWIFSEESHTSFNSTDPEKTSKEVKIPAAELPGTEFARFNIDEPPGSVNAVAQVVADKCFFFSSPNPVTQRKAFVVKGDKLRITREFTTFYEVSFTNKMDRSTGGYIRKKDVKRLPDEGFTP